MELNKIYNEDCVATMSRMPDNYIDLIVTSPPYDKLRDYKGFNFDFENIAAHIFRITKKGGVVVWIVGDGTIKNSETGSSFKQALFFMSLGFNLHDTMIYMKDSIAFPDQTRYSQVFEYMFVFSKGKPKTVNILKDKKNKWAGYTVRGHERLVNGDVRYKKDKGILNEYSIRYNVWMYGTGAFKSSVDLAAREHPAIFPEKLAGDHIYSWSNLGDIVYDPFMGSGTVAKMSHLQNRQWVGSEISSEYCDVANKRIEKYLTQYQLL